MTQPLLYLAAVVFALAAIVTNETRPLACAVVLILLLHIEVDFGQESIEDDAAGKEEEGIKEAAGGEAQ